MPDPDELEQPEGIEGDQPAAEAGGDAPETPAAAESAEEQVPRSQFDATRAERDAAFRLAEQQAAALARGQQPPAAGNAFQRNPQFENDPYTQYMDQRYAQQFAPVVQGLQGQVVQLASQNDLLLSRQTIDETYGRGTYRKLADVVETEFNAALQRGQPQSREQIFFNVARHQGMALTPATERANRETKTALRKAKGGATVETGAPAARASRESQGKPLNAMNAAELKQSLLNDPAYKDGF